MKRSPAITGIVVALILGYFLAKVTTASRQLSTGVTQKGVTGPATIDIRMCSSMYSQGIY